MHAIEIILGLLIFMTALAWLATRLHMAYPILLILGGLVIGGLGATGVVEGLPQVQLKPELVFVLLLPPILYYAGLLTSWRDFRANARPISRRRSPWARSSPRRTRWRRRPSCSGCASPAGSSPSSRVRAW
jgi:NhaP-type Na+/H+ or K+/H+ antiporter